MRATLRLLLEAQPDMEVVGEAAELHAALDKTRTTTPDVILLDLSLPGANGLQTPNSSAACVGMLRLSSSRCIRRRPTLGQPWQRGEALMSLHAAPADLIAAIHAVVQGETFVDPAVASPLLHALIMSQTLHIGVSPSQPKSLLSPREREVLIQLAQGYTSRQIAAQLHISVKSVETYRARISQKLELRSRADLIRYAHASGLLTSEMVVGHYHEISRESMAHAARRRGCLGVSFLARVGFSPKCSSLFWELP